MSEHLAWAKGGTASVLTVVDDAVTLRSTIPSPPGSRLDAALIAQPGVSVTVKIHTSKRKADGTFVLTGRLLVATRALRDRLATLASVETA